MNGPLQERTNVLDLDAQDASHEFDSNNLQMQKKLADRIQLQAKEILSILTSILAIHLNRGQEILINTSSVFLSLEAQTIQSLANKRIEQVGQASIHLPSNFRIARSSNSTVSIRSKLEQLAIYGNSFSSSHTNVSTSISISILDQNQKELAMETNESHPIEIIIPRDPNLVIPPMILQNVTSEQQSFAFHSVNITSQLSIAVHIELQPINIELSYLFIYQFDRADSEINGWRAFCPPNLTNESIYEHYIDNQRTLGHRLLIFGLRELNSTESDHYCTLNSTNLKELPKINSKIHFTFDYSLRIYASACYYLDKNNQWKSDGLTVGPKTNHYQTQCFSTHLKN